MPKLKAIEHSRGAEALRADDRRGARGNHPRRQAELTLNAPLSKHLVGPLPTEREKARAFILERTFVEHTAFSVLHHGFDVSLLRA
jgi:hypothetical protein